ncbi:hypothetical protein BOCO_0870 [Bombiscardovia coagulans]|uniref:Uncharacterized protein n=1 Tax=Bombiscardovia coagulans TaxID=686666 RepID=A0A261EU21_9BIFI|nr:hypothetical protein BOCO_0870 [Bombiscardovia coagulans]
MKFSDSVLQRKSHHLGRIGVNIRGCTEIDFTLSEGTNGAYLPLSLQELRVRLHQRAIF